MCLIDKVTNLPADATCPEDYTAAFLDGTLPSGTCSRMSDSGQSVIDQVLNDGNGTQPADSGGAPPDGDVATVATASEEAEYLQTTVRGAGINRALPPAPPPQ